MQMPITITLFPFYFSDRDHMSCDITCMDIGEINEEKNSLILLVFINQLIFNCG